MKEAIRNYLQKRIGDAAFDDDDNVFELGLLNSMVLLQLAMFVEREFGIHVVESELGLENFGTLNDMEKFLLDKKSKTIIK